MTQPRATRGLTRARHLHVTPELHKRLMEQAKQWNWPTVSAYVEHELRRILDMPTAGYERVSRTEWMIEEHEGKHVIFVKHVHNLYVFRYAQPSAAIALEVMGRLQRNFGKPAGVTTDLAANYWITHRNAKLEFMQRTTQKNTWYIPEPIEFGQAELRREGGV